MQITDEELFNTNSYDDYGNTYPYQLPQEENPQYKPEIIPQRNISENPLTDDNENDIIITDKQRGKKLGKHCPDWGLNPVLKEDRDKLEAIILDIFTNHDEVRIGKWGTL